MTNTQLNNDIHERDGDTCIITGCGRFVAPGEKWHHEPCGCRKENRIEKGLLLCYEHHQQRHFGKNSAEIRRQCESYLRNLYPEVWPC
jgi:hypothetical protein